MANKALIDYIKSQLNYGYTLMQIRQNLIANGYNEKIIDNAIDHLYHKEGLSKNTIAIMAFSVIGVIILASSLIIVLTPTKAPKKLLDIEIKEISSKVFAGERLSFIIELINMGEAANYDVQIRYEILSMSTNEIVKIKEEAIAIEKRSSKAVQMDMPYDLPKGQYMLRATALYDDKKSITTSSFLVDLKDRCANGIKDADEGGIDCDGPCITNCEILPPDINDSAEDIPDTNSTDFVNPPGEDIQPASGVIDIDEIVDLSRTDLETAGGRCDQKTGAERDHCFSAIAIDSGKDNICEFIADIDRKDSCFMNIAINTHTYSNCGQISNERLKESCELLA